MTPFGTWLIFIGLIPLISALPTLSGRSTRSIIFDFYIGGFLLSGIANLFLFQLAPENWTIQLHGWFGIISRFMAWLLVSSFCALSYTVLGFVLSRIRDFNQQLIILPLLFPLAEFIRSYLFAMMAYGPNGNLSPNFNWGSIAVPAAGTPLVYSSRLFGFYGLTLLVVIINICTFLVLLRKKILLPLGLLLGVIAISYAGWRTGSNHTPSISVASIHSNEKSDMTTVDTSTWPPEGTDILVLPEYSSLLENNEYKQILARLSPNGIAITSVAKGKPPTATNQIIILDRQGTIISSQDKTFLIPTGEYLPYSLQFGFKLIGKSQAITDFTYIQQLSKGKTPETVVDVHNGIRVGALACSGVNALSAYKTLTKQGANILTNSASLSFMNEGSMYHTYARNMARFQAVSNDRPFIQASRSGQSYIIDRNGTVLAISHGQDNQVLTAPL